MENAIAVGINYSDYWEMTYGEILLHIKVFNKRKVEEMKQKATETHTLANLIGISVARLLDEKSKFPTLYETFPGLFQEEMKAEEELRAEREWQLYKARIMEYSMWNNEKRKKEGESD